MNDNHITDNKEAQRFEMPAGNGLAFIAYRWHHERLALMHTEVPPEAEGKGIAGTLARYVLEKAKKENIKIDVYCPYVSAYIKRHPEYNVVVEKDYNL
jgi:predicted GNAT family acetyltransferase